jgi:hypothetical protein
MKARNVVSYGSLLIGTGKWKVRRMSIQHLKEQGLLDVTTWNKRGFVRLGFAVYVWTLTVAVMG